MSPARKFQPKKPFAIFASLRDNMPRAEFAEPAKFLSGKRNSLRSLRTLREHKLSRAKSAEPAKFLSGKRNALRSLRTLREQIYHAQSPQSPQSDSIHQRNPPRALRTLREANIYGLCARLIYTYFARAGAA